MDRITCPYCSSQNTEYLGFEKGRYFWRCKNCGGNYSNPE